MPASSALLLELRLAAHALDDSALGLTAYRQKVAKALCKRFKCSMASFWVFQGDDASRALRCVAALSEDSDLSVEGMELREDDFPVYFEMMRRTGVYSSPDAQSDPNLLALRDSYLIPQQIRASLDVAYQINGRLVGVLCIDQRHTPRQWSKTDTVDLRKAAATIGLAMARLQSA